jgi:hypothetical protein
MGTGILTSTHTSRPCAVLLATDCTQAEGARARFLGLLVDELPRNALGKVLKHEVREELTGSKG